MTMTGVREIMTAPVVVVQDDDGVARIAATLDQHRISAVWSSMATAALSVWSASTTCSSHLLAPLHTTS